MENALNILNKIFLFAAIVCVVLAVLNYAARIYNKRAPLKAAKADKSAGHKQIKCFSPKELTLSPRTYYIILGIIAFIGIAIRVWKFGSVPVGINQDGAMAAVDGKALAEYGTDRLGTHMPAHLYAWGVGQMSSLLSYMIAVFVKFFGLSTITTRLPQLLMSVAGGVFFYLFIRDIFGKGAGLVAAAFVAIDPWHFVQSRWAMDCNLYPHFFMGGLYFLNKGMSSAKSRYTYISMLFFALCMYCYGVSLYTIPPFLLAVCIFGLVRKKIKLKDVLISAGIYLAVAWPFLLTMMVNYFKWDTINLPFVTIQYYDKSIRSKDILMFSEEPLKQLAKNFKSLLNTTLIQKKDYIWNDIEGFGTMFFCTMPFVFAGFVELFKNKEGKGSKGLVILALLAGIWAGLFTNDVNVNRINIIYYPIMMMAVLGIYFVITEIKYLKWPVLCIYAVLGVMLVTTYFGSYVKASESAFFVGFEESFDTVRDSGADKIYITTAPTARRIGNVSEVLAIYYDKIDAEYFQGKKNEEHGKKLLPYKERFIYGPMTEDIVKKSANENAAYIICDSEKNLFDSNKYNIEDFGDYCAVTKKSK